MYITFCYHFQVLCSKEIINTGIELQEFLAYERDASIAFVKKASEVPRIDKASSMKLVTLSN